MTQMKDMLQRKPFALANWKMAMTISESLAFVKGFRTAVGDLSDSVDIVLCPPYTALHALYEAMTNSSIALGAQNLCAEAGEAHTGEISAPLLADVGCQWVMLGHWEMRRCYGDTDTVVNQKMHAALKCGMRPILLIGEGTTEQGRVREALGARLPHLFAECEPERVAEAVMVYEPEWTIGKLEPAPPDYVAAGCGFMRRWVEGEFGAGVANALRIIYGGSVAPENAGKLLASPDVDGLGAGRKGRDPVAFAEIVRLIAKAKRLA